MWLSNRSNTNRAIQAQKVDRGWKCRFRKKRNCTIRVAKKKVTAKLICTFVFAYAKCWFPHDAAHYCTYQIFLYIADCYKKLN